METKKLNNGIEVVARDGHALTYANRTQAEKKASEVGSTVAQLGRVFYVRALAGEVSR